MPAGLREGQGPALQDIIEYVQSREAHEVRGYVSMPTGSGKTVIFSEAVKQLDRPSLVLVPTRQLVDQTLAEMRTRIPNKKINSLQGREQDHGQHDVLVTTYSSIAQKVDRPDFAILPANYELVIMDEAHRSMGTMGRRYIEVKLGHAMHLGFTATEDYNNKRKLSNVLYDEVHKITVPEAVGLGMIAPYRVTSLDTLSDMSSVSVKIDDYDQKELQNVVQNPTRDKVIVQFYVENLGGEKTMFNVNTIEHAEQLATRLRSSGVNAAAIHGSMRKAEQKRLLKAYKDGDLMALCQARLLGEGFDEPSMSVAFNVTPTMSFVRSQQRSGRALRLDPNRPDKVALIIECIDTDYVRTPALFGDEGVTGWSGIDGFVPATEITHNYRGQLPEYKPLEVINGHNSAQKQNGSGQSASQKPKPLRSVVPTVKQKQELAAADRVQSRRRNQQTDFELEDINESGFNPFDLDVEKLCATNSVANYIVYGTISGDQPISAPALREALGQLAGHQLLEDSDVLSRYRTIQQHKAEKHQTSIKADSELDHGSAVSVIGKYSEYDKSDVRLAMALKMISEVTPEWQSYANCLGGGVYEDGNNRFYPERGASTKHAKEVCKACVVREDCLEYSLDKPEKIGIWGGLSERERRRLRKARSEARRAQREASSK
jgi:WhiB family redox-sensing transcriptional regulator